MTARHDQRLEAEQLQSEIGEPQARQTDEIADTPMVELVRELALLETIITTPDSTAECVLRFTSGKGAIEGMPQLAHALTTVLQSIFGDDAATRSADHHTVTIRDAAARVLAEQFAAAIWCDSHWAPDSLSFGHIESAHEPPEEAADQITVRYRLHDDLGVFLQDIILVDLRTGLEFNSEHGSQGLRPLLLTALPLPVELADMLGVPSDAVLPETVNPARPVTARASVSMDDDIPF